MINLRKHALAIAVKAIYLDDNSDYEEALWEIIRLLGDEDMVHLLEEDPKKAHDKYCVLPLALY